MVKADPFITIVMLRAFFIGTVTDMTELSHGNHQELYLSSPDNAGASG